MAEGEQKVIAASMGWFGEALGMYKELELAKRSNPSYYSRANDNSRESVGTNDPRPNVTPNDPAKNLGVDIVAPTLGAGGSGFTNGLSNTAVAIGALFVLGFGFLAAGLMRAR